MTTAEEKRKNLGLGLLGCLIFTAAVAAASALVYFGGRWVLSLQRDISTIIVTGLLTLLAGFAVKGFEIWYTARTKVKADTLSRRRETYQKLLDDVFTLVMSSNSKRPVRAQHQQEQWISETFPRLLVWASPEVARGFGDWITGFGDNHPGTEQSLLSFRHIVNPIRRDLGLQPLGDGDIKALFLDLPKKST
ncbi:MAG: hypothetical protein ABFE08_23670 [Armatimonadia bacterium]